MSLICIRKYGITRVCLKKAKKALQKEVGEPLYKRENGILICLKRV